MGPTGPDLGRWKLPAPPTIRRHRNPALPVPVPPSPVDPGRLRRDLAPRTTVRCSLLLLHRLHGAEPPNRSPTTNPSSPWKPPQPLPKDLPGRHHPGVPGRFARSPSPAPIRDEIPLLHHRRVTGGASRAPPREPADAYPPRPRRMRPSRGGADQQVPAARGQRRHARLPPLVSPASRLSPAPLVPPSRSRFGIAARSLVLETIRRYVSFRRFTICALQLLTLTSLCVVPRVLVVATFDLNQFQFVCDCCSSAQFMPLHHRLHFYA